MTRPKVPPIFKRPINPNIQQSVDDQIRGALGKHYTPEEFAQVMADLSDGLITVRIYDDDRY